MEEILEVLEKNSRYKDEEIATMTGKTVEEVREAIRDYEEKNIIAGYTTLINWENTGKETVTALIEVTVIYEGKTMKEVALFLSEKLAIQEYVTGTATHFVLKKYKDHGRIFKEKKNESREAIFI